MDSKSFNETLKIFKALSDQNRLRVFIALHHHSELCVCQLVDLLDLKPPTVSQHLSILQDAGLLSSRRCGRWVYYRLGDQVPSVLSSWLPAALGQTATVVKDRAALRCITAPCYAEGELLKEDAEGKTPRIED